MEKERLLYRFRPMYSLLEKYNELENEEIYFSSVEELNDPLEDFLAINFDGDKILWTNFLKNYLFCLFQFRLTLALAEDDKEYTADDIHPYYDETLRTISSIKGQKFYDICEKILTNEAVQNLVDYLSSQEQPITNTELCLLLQAFHFYFLEVLVSFDRKTNNDYEITVEHQNLDMLNIILNTIKNSKNSRDLFKFLINFINEMNNNNILLRKLTSSDNSVKEKNFILLLDYPKLYLNKLPEIMFPNPFIACFSKDYRDLSLWGYYADSSKGACLIYKVEEKNNSLFLPIEKVTTWGGDGENFWERKEYTELEIKPVAYEKQKPWVSFFRSLGRISHTSLVKYWYSDENQVSEKVKDLVDYDKSNEWRINYWQNISNNINTKHINWKHEQEYRIVEQTMYSDMYDTKDKRKLKYKFSNLRGLIFGINTSDEDKLETIKILKAKCNNHNIKDFKLYQAIYNNKIGEVEIIPMRTLDCIEIRNEKK